MSGERVIGLRLVANLLKVAVVVAGVAGIWWVTGWGWMRWIFVATLALIVAAQFMPEVPRRER